eukprot:GHRR01020835.1.p1 GENE.GHRR01020835.1~~GHRR01020835.1.p1  ORF type:complete len:115 (-),score=16.25 GHRR01020835.1:4-348(-)
MQCWWHSLLNKTACKSKLQPDCLLISNLHYGVVALQEYMFTLTQGDGTRGQGFCRRFLPPAPRVGSKLRYPQVLCLVCEIPWSSLFFKVCWELCSCVCTLLEDTVCSMNYCTAV